MKICSTCKVSKPLDMFHANKSAPDGKQIRCKDCGKLAKEKYLSANPEKRKLTVEKYRKANLSKCREASRICKSKTKDKAKQWVEKNIDKVRQYKTKWCKENHETVLAFKAKRRAKERNAGGSFTSAQIKKLLTLQKYKCACCKIDISKGFHRDHIQPLALGGSNDILNIQLLCQPCNQSKSKKDPLLFMQERGYLL